MEEPSVLDYVKSKLMPWRAEKINLPADVPAPVQPEERKSEPQHRGDVPWLVFAALFLALPAQMLLEPPDPNPLAAVVLYALAAVGMVWGAISYKGLIRPVEPEETEKKFSDDFRAVPFVAAGVLILIGFVLFGGNRFTLVNTLVWLLAIGCLLWALWQPAEDAVPLLQRARSFLQSSTWRFSFSRWTLLALFVFGIAAFFRFYRLSQVPGEMFSDQAEKLWDVMDLLNGQTKIFFERNTGREAFQFYLTAAVSKLFGTGISFMSLKIGTALAGFFTLPFIYLLGKEINGRWTGLLALFLAGIGYWPNVIARIGLRFPLYPLFVAPTLYFLVRGLRRRSRNDLLLSGIALGIGLHGYSPIRILPFVVVAAVVIYLLHRQSAGIRREAWGGLIILALAAFVLFLPLFRYALIENPEMFSSRALTRLSGVERPLPGSVLSIFFGNLWSALTMFFWNNGNIWVHSVPNRPALDVVSGALFFLGLIIVIIRYIRGRNWADLFLLLSIPLLMMPSILSLAFPEENPSLNRSGGAYIPVFIIAAVALEAVLRTIKERIGPRWGLATAVLVALLVLPYSASQNANLVFDQFDRQFMAGAWNTTQIGKVVRGFADSVGTADTAYVVPYPYWVDTRLVGINAGFPDRDYALWPNDFEMTLADPRTKMFILKPEDSDSLAKLVSLYPQGTLSRYLSGKEGKDFMIYLIPGEGASAQGNPLTP